MVNVPVVAIPDFDDAVVTSGIKAVGGGERGPCVSGEVRPGPVRQISVDRAVPSENPQTISVPLPGSGGVGQEYLSILFERERCLDEWWDTRHRGLPPTGRSVDLT
jgi:hypothetical protein